MDTTGCFTECGGAIETFTGKIFPLTGDIDPALIDIEDIAHALSLTCRYAGHCKKFYSVAEHCLHVRGIIHRRGGNVHLQRMGLLHDAAEAYLGDVTRPLKSLMPQYRDIERCLQKKIYERFDLIPNDASVAMIREADNAVLKAESRVLMSSRGSDWNFGGVDAAHIVIVGRKPEEAEASFLKMFYRIA